ncbi:MAG: twin-arginine translocase subunit TatC [Bernardetiaceae bacterium]
MSTEKEMSFLDHLEELRWHLIRAVVAVGVCTIVAFVSKEIVFGMLILGPSRTDFLTYQLLCQLSEITCIDQLPFIIQSRKITGQFTMHIAASVTVGLIVAFPYVFWEIWRFIKPGLYATEQRVASGATFFVSLLFLTGVLFGYFIITPLSINFLSNYQVDPSVMNEFDITSYVGTVTMLTLSCGLMFQLPMVVLFLSKAGLVSPQLMRQFRRHALVAILFVAALLTPPDVVSQFLISIPLVLLYEISIQISHRVWKNREKELRRMGLMPDET